VDLYALAEVGVLPGNDIAVDLAPVIDPDVAVRYDAAVQRTKLADDDVFSLQPIIDCAAIPDDDIILRLQGVLLQFGAVGE